MIYETRFIADCLGIQVLSPGPVPSSASSQAYVRVVSGITRRYWEYCSSFPCFVTFIFPYLYFFLIVILTALLLSIVCDSTSCIVFLRFRPFFMGIAVL